MMPRGLLLEYMGTLLIVASLMFTHANPIVAGLAYMSALFIADGKSEGFFTPLGVLVQYLLGRIGLTSSVKLLAAQVAAAASVVLLYKGRIPMVHSKVQ
jgi:hypothetical protein